MSSNSEVATNEETGGGMGLFERYLSVWVALAIMGSSQKTENKAR